MSKQRWISWRSCVSGIPHHQVVCPYCTQEQGKGHPEWCDGQKEKLLVGVRLSHNGCLELLDRGNPLGTSWVWVADNGQEMLEELLEKHQEAHHLGGDEGFQWFCIFMGPWELYDLVQARFKDLANKIHRK